MGMSSWWPEITLSPPAPSRFKIFHHYKRHCHQSGKCSYIRAEQRLFCFLLFIMVSVHLSQRIKCLKFLEMHTSECLLPNQYYAGSTFTDEFQAMLSGPGQFAENETNEVHTICPLAIGILYNFQVNFREIPSHVLQKVCMYFTYKTRYYCYLAKITSESDIVNHYSVFIQLN